MKTLLLFATCTLIIISCSKTGNPMLSQNFDKEGHRGCRGLMPENTIPAMLYAIDLNVSTLEMDLQVTKDSQVIVSHDPWLNPDITTRPDGSYITPSQPKYTLFKMNYDSIRQFDVGYKFYDQFPQQAKLHVAIPLLSSLIDSVEAYCKEKNKTINYSIEIKCAPDGDKTYHPAPEKFVELVMNVLNQKQMTERVTIESFDFRSLQYLHLKYPQIKTSVLIEQTDKRPLEAVIDSLGFIPTTYSTHYSRISDNLVMECHSKGILVVAWTGNDSWEIKKLRNKGVDGIMSDYPNLFDIF